MRPWLLGTIVAASVAAGVLTEIFLFRVFDPPDDTAAVAAAGWVALPYLATVALAARLRRHTPVLIILLVALGLVALPGLTLLDGIARGLADARQRAATAVLPGESPDSGPGGMRKAGADAGVFVAGLTAGAALAVVPAVGLGVVAAAGGVGYAVVYWLRERAAVRQLWVTEHTDTRNLVD